jgi:hypothetical protein
MVRVSVRGAAVSVFTKTVIIAVLSSPEEADNLIQSLPGLSICHILASVVITKVALPPSSGIEISVRSTESTLTSLLSQA